MLIMYLVVLDLASWHLQLSTFILLCAGASTPVAIDRYDVLQVVGVIVAGRFAASRLVFAEDRKRTAEEFKCAIRLCRPSCRP